jgi:hypothetical protein
MHKYYCLSPYLKMQLQVSITVGVCDYNTKGNTTSNLFCVLMLRQQKKTKGLEQTLLPSH